MKCKLRASRLIITYQKEVKNKKMAKKIKVVKVKSSKIENEKVCALLSYLLIGIIWYFVDEKMKKSEIARYHVKQGLVLLISWIIYSIIISVLFSIIILPLIMSGLFIGTIAMIPIVNLLNLIPLIFMIIGIINALNEKQKPLPIIGHFAEKFDF